MEAEKEMYKLSISEFLVRWKYNKKVTIKDEYLNLSKLSLNYMGLDIGYSGGCIRTSSILPSLLKKNCVALENVKVLNYL